MVVFEEVWVRVLRIIFGLVLAKWLTGEEVLFC
jgi:hypothetical protein